MKTETQRAEQYIEDLKKYEKLDGRWHIVNRTCHEHKFACQRFLEFLNGLVGVLKTNQESSMRLEDKTIDLKQAIKLYEDVGI